MSEEPIFGGLLNCYQSFPSIPTSLQQYEPSLFSQQCSTVVIPSSPSPHHSQKQGESSDPLALATKMESGSIQGGVKTGENWRCVYCSKVLSTKGNLKIHLDTVHSGASPHVCRSCHKTFSSKGNLKTHVENIHGQGKKEWLCSFCSKTLSSKGNLKLHIKNVHKSLDAILPNTPPTSSSQNSIILPSQSEWRCEFCFKVQASKADLKTHIEELHASELGLRKAASWTCGFCYKALASKAALSAHVQLVHEKKKDIKCDSCDSRFNTHQALKEHVKDAHQVQTPQTIQSYFCEFCPRDLYGRPTKLFAHPKDLQGHMYTEHGVTISIPDTFHEEKCSLCLKDFPSREDLQNHLIKDHAYGS